jgi:hypothetical protein
LSPSSELPFLPVEKIYECERRLKKEFKSIFRVESWSCKEERRELPGGANPPWSSLKIGDVEGCWKSSDGQTD